MKKFIWLWFRLMQYDRLSFKAIFFIILLSAVCAPVTSKADDLEEAQAAFNSKDYAKAVHLLTPLAEQGNATAANGLGGLYLQGLGVSRNYSEALRWFLKAAEQGHPDGQYSLGWMYEKGLGVTQDYSEAVKWYRKSAEQGYPRGQTLLGTMYGSGRGVPQDYSEAMKWYRSAADQGDPNAHWEVGAMYAEGQGVPKDYVEAEKWFRKGASQGEPHGQLWLGRLYLEGWSVSKDVAEAAKWYKLAVDQFRRAGVPVGSDPADKSASALLLRAMLAPPEALALSYLGVKSVLHFLPAAAAGATIQLPGETITKSNVEEYRGRYEKRLSLYGEAIKQRGYKTISGAYKGETTKSCARIQSLWVGVIHERGQSGIEIAQDGIEAQVVLRGKHEGKELNLKNQAAIAESAISVLDAMNSDYFFRGEIKDQVIVIKPNLSVLDRWPEWAGPPSRSDLENCTITLKPLSADSGSEQR
jgi:TPR repeat protein